MARIFISGSSAHNAGIGYREPNRVETEDGLPEVFATNVLAPYVLTALIDRPTRLVYLSSGMHLSVDASLDDFAWSRRRWSGATAYAESKLHDVLLAFAAARRWPGVLSNALEPGWVATRMGGPGAPDDMDQAHRTQAWLAVSDDAAATVMGEYFITCVAAARTRRRATRTYRTSCWLRASAVRRFPGGTDFMREHGQ